jgi:hypothetical protein
MTDVALINFGKCLVLRAHNQPRLVKHFRHCNSSKNGCPERGRGSPSRRLLRAWQNKVKCRCIDNTLNYRWKRKVLGTGARDIYMRAVANTAGSEYLGEWPRIRYRKKHVLSVTKLTVQIVLELQLQWHALRMCRRHLFSWITGDDGALLRVSGLHNSIFGTPWGPRELSTSEAIAEVVARATVAGAASATTGLVRSASKRGYNQSYSTSLYILAKPASAPIASRIFTQLVAKIISHP